MKLGDFQNTGTGFFTSLIFLFGALPALAQVNTIVLKNKHVEIKITPDLGGRVLAFSVPDKPNVLLINEEEIARPVKEISHTTGFREYFGHINWVSPQSQWWMYQKHDLEKKVREANWPPDPFLIFKRNAIIEQNNTSLRLAGSASPISGIKFLKTFSLVENKRSTVDLNVVAVNIRDAEVSWGIWFNTRIKPVSQVYVPIEGKPNVRIENYDSEKNIPAGFEIAEGFFSYRHGVLPTADKDVRSKAFIQPAQGWMAAFVEGQIFLIQFPLHAREKIHPEQGQVEIYHAYQRNGKNGGMLEMEVHAPYVTLKPGEQMQALERWTVLPYNGNNTRADHIAFLKQLASKKIISEINEEG